MHGVVVVVRPVRPGCEERHGLVEEALVRRRVRHVGAEVDGGGVDLGVGGDVGDGREEEVHLARVVRLVVGGAVEPGLQDVREEERSAEGHVVQVQQRRPVGEHRVDVDLLDVGLVGDHILGHL